MHSLKTVVFIYFIPIYIIYLCYFYILYTYFLFIYENVLVPISDLIGLENHNNN